MSITTLDEILRVHLAGRPDKIAMRAGDRRWTYAQLHDESCRVASGLLAEGISPGDRVAFLDRNVPEYFGFLFGALMTRAVTLAVNWRLAAPEMEYILNHAQARVLLIGEEFLPHLAQMELESVKRVIVIGEADEFTSHADWIASHPAVDPELPCDPDDTCYQLYTSGTTGLPKGVELTHRNLLAAVGVGAREWSVDEDSVSMVAMPLFHIAGSGWAIGGFYQGGESVLVRDFDPREVLRLIEAHGVTNTLFVPAVLQVLSSMPDAEKTDFSSLRSIVYGASPISEQVLVRSMEVFGCGFVQVYGLTETTGAITVMPAEDHDPGGPRAHLLRSAGRPWGDVGIRIVDAETNRDLPDGEVGEIWIRSVQNMKGYWRNPEATDEAFPEGRDENGLGWFRTGDAGYLRDGYLFIHDRVKDMIVSGGENIYPAEIENVLMSHPAVADVAVIGVPSEKWGETVKAIVVDAPGGGASDEELIAWCRERLAHYKCPSSVDRIDSLPRNPSGKILKTELREPYWKGRERRVN
ncbi:MAG TPA: long-chain-fatty-acid--CoA ligase [Deltaproteobacteria bacterium]|nr:long-chain-fatty-acid--CoA ligase [Deltaproteobacteria bacterium]